MNDQSAPQAHQGPALLAPGLYFGLSEEAYHGDPALGSGAVRALAKAPVYYWLDSHMNPLREQREETPALLFGRALHKLVLEGGEAFKRAYAREPTLADHPGALVTQSQIVAVLRALGEKVSGSKAEVTERLRAVKPDAIFWDDIMADFHAACVKAKATPMKADVYARVVTGANFIAGDERVAAAFQGGRPEVSVFWDMDGVRLKARLDYVRLGKEKGRTVALITDLKTFANKYSKPPERAVMHAIADSRLDIQAASYLTGAALIPEFIKAGLVFGAEDINKDWLTALAGVGPNDWVFNWCFYEKDAPISLLRKVGPQSAVVEAARGELMRALESYREHMGHFGTAWRFVDPIPEINVEPDDLPRWIGL